MRDFWERVFGKRDEGGELPPPVMYDFPNEQQKFQEMYPPTPMIPPRLSIEERLEMLVARGVTIEFDETMDMWRDHSARPSNDHEAMTLLITVYQNDESIGNAITDKNKHLDWIDDKNKAKEKFEKLKERFDPQQKEASPTEPPTTPK